MQIILDLLKGDWFKPVATCCLIFLIWQVTNHLPRQIKEVNHKIEKLDNKIDKLSYKIDQNNNAMNKRFDDIYKVLIDIKNK